MKPTRLMGLPLRAFHVKSRATDWNLIWESGPYLRRFSELLDQSRKFVILLGWQLDSRLLLPSPDAPGARRLRDALRTHCEAHPDFHAYLLLWAHPTVYMPLREVWQRSIWAQVHRRVHFVLDSRHPFGGSHHEKLILFDGKTALCGGVDLCDGRWDSPHHRFRDPLRSLLGKKESHGPYHDLSVEVRGPVVRELWDHAAWRWNRVAEVPLPDPPAARYTLSEENATNEPGTTVYVSRTSTLRAITFSPSPRGPFPQIREAESAMLALVRLARRRILIEAQYFWSRPFARELARRIERARREPGTRLDVGIILADLRRIRGLSRLMADKTYTLLAQLQSASAENPGVSLEITHPQSLRRGHRPRPIYVHSKVMVIDDRWLSIGSVNLADRAFRLDSELQLIFEAATREDRARIDTIAARITEHWNRPPGLRLARIDPWRLRRRYRKTHPVIWRIPWERAIDPARPWLEGFVRALSRLPGIGRALLRGLRRWLEPVRIRTKTCAGEVNRSKKKEACFESSRSTSTRASARETDASPCTR